jgi:hypothetical protein
MEAATHAVHDEHHGPPPANVSSRVEAQFLGMLLFIISEIMLFGAFFTAYFFIRVVGEADWPAQGEELPVAIAGVNTAILLSSSFTMHWALEGARNENRNAMRVGLLTTALLGLAVLLLRPQLDGGTTRRDVSIAPPDLAPFLGRFGLTSFFKETTGFYRSDPLPVGAWTSPGCCQNPAPVVSFTGVFSLQGIDRPCPLLPLTVFACRRNGSRTKERGLHGRTKSRIGRVNSSLFHGCIARS